MWDSNGAHHAHQDGKSSKAGDPGTIVDHEMFSIQRWTTVNMSGFWSTQHYDDFYDAMEGNVFVYEDDFPEYKENTTRRN